MSDYFSFKNFIDESRSLNSREIIDYFVDIFIYEKDPQRGSKKRNKQTAMRVRRDILIERVLLTIIPSYWPFLSKEIWHFIYDMLIYPDTTVEELEILFLIL